MCVPGSASGYLTLRAPGSGPGTHTGSRPVLGQGHIQEVILRVAIEGATEAHSVLHPSLIHLQVEPQPFPVIEDQHAHVGPHPQEHGGQPPNLKSICQQNGKRDVRSLFSTAQPSPSPVGRLPRPHPALASSCRNPVLWDWLAKPWEKLLRNVTEWVPITTWSPWGLQILALTQEFCNDSFLQGSLQEAHTTIMMD